MGIMTKALQMAAKDLKRRHAAGDIDLDNLWRTGNLRYKFWPVQNEMAKTLTLNSTSRKRLLNCSRRIRKTTTTILLCLEDLISKELPAPIHYISGTMSDVRKIVQGILKDILPDCPPDMRPTYHHVDNYYYFPTYGNRLYICAANNGKADNIRGQASYRCVIDEAQNIDDLRYLIDSVVMPMLITTDGQIWITMTPPTSPAHEVAKYVQEARESGSYAEFDIYKSGYPPDIISSFCQEAGGANSTSWLREYMCKFVVDSEFALVREWDDKYAYSYNRDRYYPFYHKYVAMDIGVADKTVVIFGTYDFLQAKLFIQDEFCLQGTEMITSTVAAKTKHKEKELFGDQKPKLRISDNNNLVLLQDLAHDHKLSFAPTSKDTLEAMVNNLREWVKSGRIVVDPKCEQTLGCLRYGVWNKQKNKFDKSTKYGHYDALAALMYLVRNVDRNTNPIPVDLDVDGINTARTFYTEEEQAGRGKNDLAKLWD